MKSQDSDVCFHGYLQRDLIGIYSGSRTRRPKAEVLIYVDHERIVLRHTFLCAFHNGSRRNTRNTWPLWLLYVQV